jgi:tetratricopeptide (TPR) repeat protein
VDRSRRILGPAHRDTLEAMLSLGRALCGAGDRASGRSLSEQALAATVATLGHDDPAAVAALTQHSRLLLSLDDDKAAAAAYRELYDTLTRLPGQDEIAVLDALAGLTDATGRCGDFRKARDFDEQLLDRRRELLGSDHVGVLWALGDLAWNLERLGDLGGAADRFGEVADARIRLLGPDAPKVLWALKAHARVLGRMEAHADARRAYATLYQTQRRVAGAEAEETLEALRALAWELGKVGELDESRRRWEELTGILERLYGPKDDRTLNSLVWLAETLEDLGDEEGARGISDRVAGPLGRLYASSSDSEGPDAPATLRLGHNLGLTLERLGQLEAARTTYQTVIDGYVRLQGRRGRSVADMHGHLADIARKMSDPESAHALYCEAVGIMRKQPGPDDPDTLRLIGRDADALESLGRTIAARNQARAALDGSRRALGEGSMLTKKAKARLERLSKKTVK